MASSISGSLTATTSSTSVAVVERDLADAAREPVRQRRPGRIVEQRPAEAERLREARATPRAAPRPLSCPGDRAFTTVAMPARSPPPPTGTSDRAGGRALARSSSADRALARGRARVLEGVDEDGARRLLEGPRPPRRHRRRSRPSRAPRPGTAQLLDLGARRGRRDEERRPDVARAPARRRRRRARGCPPRRPRRRAAARRRRASRAGSSAPRTLNEPVGCQHSSFSSSSRSPAPRGSAAAASAAGARDDRRRACGRRRASAARPSLTHADARAARPRPGRGAARRSGRRSASATALAQRDQRASSVPVGWIGSPTQSEIAPGPRQPSRRAGRGACPRSASGTTGTPARPRP